MAIQKYMPPPWNSFDSDHIYIIHLVPTTPTTLTYTMYSYSKNHQYFHILSKLQKIMKNSKKIHAFSTNQSKIQFLNTKELQFPSEIIQKIHSFKRSASLSSKNIINQDRMKKIAEIYRTLSLDKINTSKCKLKKVNTCSTPEKNLRSCNQNSPYYTCNLTNFFDSQNKTKRLVIDRKGTQNASKFDSSIITSLAQAMFKVKNTIKSLEEILNQKDQKNFHEELAQFEKSMKDRSRKENKNDQFKDMFYQCIQLLNACNHKIILVKEKQIRKQYHHKEHELLNVKSQLQKKTLKNLLLAKQIEKLVEKNKAFDTKITELKQKLERQTKQIGVNTEDTSLHLGSICNKIQFPEDYFLKTNLLTPSQKASKDSNHCLYKLTEERVVEHDYKDQLEKCQRKLQLNQVKQRELLNVLVILKKQGIDVESVFEDVASGKQEIETESEEELKHNLQKINKENKHIERKYRNFSEKEDYFADDSIISSADGLSINYGQTMEEEAYPIKNQYKCKKQLDPELKARLQLNLNALYEDQLFEDDEDELLEDENPPTV